ncbi:MAG TPA: DUF732 domain-containing protein [Mycobacterium sp.]|jgi:hypothetical protein|nr:DUF732 domain-containing protein [Mycobacterium sp.]
MRLLLMAFGVAATVGLAAPAQAEPGVDASFVDALTKAGISFNDPNNAVEAGHTTCDLLAKGKPGLQVVQLVQQQNSGISTVNAAKFTAIAVSAYCPQYVQQVGGSGGQQ